jgi:uncharacterized membrane protein YfcA
VTFALLLFAGLASGFVNSLAGGGIIFPTLIAVGLPPIQANASSTAVLFPVQFVSAFAGRSVLDRMLIDWRNELVILCAISLAGGASGASLLLVMPATAFAHTVPWLLLFGTSIFLAGIIYRAPFEVAVLPLFVCRSLHFLVSLYGGFFGGGLGVLVLAVLRCYGIQDVRVMNAIKVVLNSFIGIAAVGLFIASGLIRWRETLVMMAAASVGAYCGTKFGLRVSRRLVEAIVIFVGFGLTIYFFVAGV